MAAFTAAGTSYATHGEPMIPVYVFYSMFGFQRTGDSMWAAMDQMARGFIIGATAGRTTLTGEGLQHADGHSPILAAMNPAMKVYDPAYGYEIAHIVRAGIEQMYGPDSDDPQRHVLPDGLQRADAAAGRARRRRRRGHRPRSPPDQHRRRLRPEGAAARLRRLGAVGPGGGDDPGLGVGGQRRRLVGHLLDRAAPRRPGRARSTTSCIPTRSRGRRT